ncbi:hypothetical protein L6452_19254 [Arctium lappa]|uniref:Uncharacterized protein n=1 Tax=Arctium lappa TaxID=4217 RepID=A0ACB9B870_ARCLA|nr:hypothetical protein L6452_19254 [Arctium lappa]
MGISSITSVTTTSSVPAMTIVATTTVTPPITSVLQQPPEVISTIQISSIPITHPPFSLVSNPPSLSQQPQVASIGPEHQTFEEDMHFYNMFDNSGPNLATVDTHVNNLAAKVECLTTSVTGSTTAVNKASEPL